MRRATLTLLLLPPALQLQVQPHGESYIEEQKHTTDKGQVDQRPECGCDGLELTSEDSRTHRSQGAALGSYQLVEGVREAGWPVWRHQHTGLLLYRSNKSSAWVVGRSLGSETIRLDNRGLGCPHLLTTAWRVARGSEAGLLEDATLRARCPGWPCGREVCGPNAHCDPKTGHCACDLGSGGDPLLRCFPRISSLCNCHEIQLTTDNPAARANQHGSFGKFFLYGSSSGYPVYQHQSGLLYLYQQDGTWLISNQAGSRTGGIQNQGDPSMCPYRFKTAWEYADVNLPGWQWSYDYTAGMVCSQDPCSVTKCGQRATCTPQGSEASCSCDIGYDGNPYTRCFPVEVPSDCSCTEVTVSSTGRAAVTQSDKMGMYFMFGYYAGEPVYQHQSGQEYLFRAAGQAWAIGATPGGLRVGVISFTNSSCPYRVAGGWQHSTRGKLDEDPGLEVACRTHSMVQNPIVRTTEATTTTQETTTMLQQRRAEMAEWLEEQLERGEQEQQQDMEERRLLEEQVEELEGQHYGLTSQHILERDQLLNHRERGTFEEQLSQLEAQGIVEQGSWEKDGRWEVEDDEEWKIEKRWEKEQTLLESLETGMAAERRVTNAIQALEELEVQHGQLEPPGLDGGGESSTVVEGIVTVRTGGTGVRPVLAVQELEERPTPRVLLEDRNSQEQNSVDRLATNHVGQDEDQQPGESIQLYFFSTPSSPTANHLPTSANQRPTKKKRLTSKRPAFIPTIVPRRKTFTTRLRLPHTMPTTLPRTLTSTLKATTQSFNTLLQSLTTSRRKTTPAPPPRPQESQNLHPAYTSSAISTSSHLGQLEQRVVEHQLSSPNPTGVTSDICNCSTIIITSNNPVTVGKHSEELGEYLLAGEVGGRPVYRHVGGNFYLYYQEESGGNWLVNTSPGLLYGGIQNSKDFPVCPYLLPTVWQYGDSEVGGWVYDPSLQVTCPSHPCSVVKCGFRASCSVEGGAAQCRCRSGFQGDPYSRCYPRVRDSCSCSALMVESRGASRDHQRDKMGAFHLWGYYNNHPVYQHYSGLDFLYFHKNQVWGVGPKVGGKRAGLLNFSGAGCPYEVSSPWQFGTKEPGRGRQLDTHLTVTCTD